MPVPPPPVDIFPGAGAFVIDGKNVGLDATNRLQAAAGSFGIVGFEPDVSATNRLRAYPGDFNVDSVGATVTLTPTLFAGVGAMAISGKAINTTPSPLPRWFGPNATDCDCCPCSACLPMFTKYSVSSITLTGVSGPVALVTDPGSIPYTWEGFFPGTNTLPGATCLEYVRDNYDTYTSSIPVGWYKKSIGNTIGLWGGGRFGTRPELTASHWFQCLGHVPWVSFGFGVGYALKGVPISTLINEAAFPDWAWDDFYPTPSLLVPYRRARRTYSDGTLATFSYGPATFYGAENISASIGYTAYITGPTLPVRAVTMPAMPYDYLGAFVGTVTIG